MKFGKMKQCQSCGMPLMTDRTGDCRGTEANGSKSEKWCSLCYKDGKFISADCTLDQMTAIVDTALKEQKASFFMRKLALRQLPTLERWR